MSAGLESVSKGEGHKRSTSSGLKLFLLSTLYFLIIASYSILRDLKSSVFMATVGKEDILWARIGGLLIFIPAILFYSKLVDHVRRYHLLVAYSLFYAISTFIFAYFIGHPEIGIANTQQDPHRVFGWIFYFFVEGFSPFVLSVFWSFVGSVTNPEDGKKDYGIMVAGSKLGGIFSTGLAWILLETVNLPLIGRWSGIAKHQLLMVFVGCLLLLIPVVVMILMRKVSGYQLHGYEAVYKVEKQRSKEGKADTGVFAGLKMLMKYPYVMGIFCMVFFYEMLNVVLSYLRLALAESASANVTGVSSFLFKWDFIMHVTGLLVAVFGTGAILNKLGMRIGLMLIPASMALGAFAFFVSNNATWIMLAYTFTKMMHYAFSMPARELLYIPTLKEVKFKAKSWIDAFGGKFAKSAGASVTLGAVQLGTELFLPIMMSFFVLIIGIWFVISFFLGLRYERAVKKNEIIGFEPAQGQSETKSV
jgi:ATP:ADP antiporter, AAA family